MDLEIDFSESSPKRTGAQNASFWTKCSISVAREPPISLPSHSRFERVCLGPARTRAKKIAQKPGPPPAQHVAAPGLSELSGFHSTTAIRKSGELAPNSLVTERGVGVGLPTPPDFHSGGPRIFSSTLCTTVWENTRRGAKILPRCVSPRIFSGSGRCTPVASENFFHHRGTKIVFSESISSAPYSRGRNLLHRQCVARDDHPWAHNLEGELSVESILSRPTAWHFVQQIG